MTCRVIEQIRNFRGFMRMAAAAVNDVSAAEQFRHALTIATGMPVELRRVSRYLLPYAPQIGYFAIVGDRIYRVSARLCPGATTDDAVFEARRIRYVVSEIAEYIQPTVHYCGNSVYIGVDGFYIIVRLSPDHIRAMRLTEDAYL